MGTFSYAISLGDPTAERLVGVEALVDTGATYTMVPASLLRDLGIVPHTSRQFLLADGRAIEWQMGRSWDRVGDQQEITLLIFGDDGTSMLLGAYTLEAFRLSVDPVDQHLPIPGLLMPLASNSG